MWKKYESGKKRGGKREPRRAGEPESEILAALWATAAALTAEASPDRARHTPRLTALCDGHPADTELIVAASPGARRTVAPPSALWVPPTPPVTSSSSFRTRSAAPYAAREVIA
jgi:hypothetical protein